MWGHDSKVDTNTEILILKLFIIENHQTVSVCPSGCAMILTQILSFGLSWVQILWILADPLKHR
jgi:hypothetical protein